MPTLTEVRLTDDLALRTAIEAVEGVAPSAGLVVDIATAFAACETASIDLGAIGAPSVEGTLFARTGKIGHQPPGEVLRGMRAPLAGRRPAAGLPPSSLLAMLLPLLLPPARREIGAEPLALPHPLYAFQADGVRWLVEHTPGALLADDMGLGKTVQAIVALRRLHREGLATRSLVVAPKAVITSWRRHLQEWAPELQTIVVEGTPQERKMLWRGIDQGRAHVALTNYDSVVRDLPDVAAIPFSVLVVDEAQNLKNAGTNRAQSFLKVRAGRRWGLTGTPLENRVDELANILRFLDRGLLPAGEISEGQAKNAASQIMLRRRKADVLPDLPDLLSRVEYVSLGPRQRATYEAAESEGVARLRRGTVTITNVLALITALKQICNGVPGESAKTEWLEDYVGAAIDAGEKSLVFSQFVETLTHLGAELSGFEPRTYTGALASAARDRVVDEFQRSAGAPWVLLMSLRAGGVGITLTRANHVVHFDSWWNPAVTSQATARAHRIGQTRDVIATTLVAENSIEERIQQILAEKRDLFDRVVDDLSTEGLSRALTERELYGLFGLEPPARAAR